MRGAIRRRLTGGVERKAKEYEPSNTVQRRFSLGLRCHPPAERLTPGEEGYVRQRLMRRSDGSDNGGTGKGRTIGPTTTGFHVGELEAQAGDAPSKEAQRHRLHKRVVHSSARSMRQDKGCQGRRGHLKQARHGV